MKRLIFSLISLALGAQFTMSAVIPVSEDTYSSANGTIAKVAGKAGGLLVSGTGAAFIRFDVKDFAGLIAPDAVKRARMVIYVRSVQTAGDLGVHPVTGEWTEAATGSKFAPPYVDAFTTVPAEALRAGQFVTIDITEEVKTWLGSPLQDFGVALEGAEIRNLQLGSKEGSVFGHPAWLEIETGAVVENDELAGGIDAAKLGNGSVTNEEFGYLHGVLSPLQEQLTTLNTTLTTVTADSAEKVNRAGDTMTGSLTVKGDVKIGDKGQFFAASGDEDLRIVRGTLIFKFTNASPQIEQGKGFTITQAGISKYNDPLCDITFDTPFSAPPTVTAIMGWPDGEQVNEFLAVTRVTATGLRFVPTVPFDGTRLHFIVVGPR